MGSNVYSPAGSPQSNPNQTLLPQNPNMDNLKACLEKQEIIRPSCLCDPGSVCDCAERLANGCELFAYNTSNASAIAFLSDSKDLFVLAALAANPNTSPQILAKIYDRNTNEPEGKEYSMFQMHDNIMAGIADNRNTPPQILSMLGIFNASQIYEKTHILGHVAGNPSTPIETLRSLSRHGHWSVLNELATNPNLPVDVMEYLSGNPDGIEYPFNQDARDNMHAELARNPSTPREILLKFLQNNESLDFWGNIVKIEGEILTMPSTDRNYGYYIYQLAVCPSTSIQALQEIIERDPKISHNEYTIAEWARINLDNRTAVS